MVLSSIVGERERESQIGQVGDGTMEERQTPTIIISLKHLNV